MKEILFWYLVRLQPSEVTFENKGERSRAFHTSIGANEVENHNFLEVTAWLLSTLFIFVFVSSTDFTLNEKKFSGATEIIWR